MGRTPIEPTDIDTQAKEDLRQLHVRFTQRILRVLEKRKISQTDLAWKMRCKRQHISVMLDPDSERTVTLGFLVKVARALDLDVDFVIKHSPKKGAKK